MASELTPVAGNDRIGLLDTMRGVAVLGILLMNVTAFGLPYSYDDPTMWGAESAVDFAVWRAMSLFVEGTMRGLFTLLFGASALLFLQRHASRGADLSPTDLYFRRTLWLIVFGLINGYLLLWSGDILFLYGVAGLILFVFRDLSPRRLIVLSAAFMTLQTLVTVVEYSDYRETQAMAEAASLRQVSGQPLSAADRHAIETFETLQDEFRPSRDSLAGYVENVRASYASAFSVLSRDTWFMQTDFSLRHGIVECLGMMLLGMALLQLGVLTGASPTRVYVTMIVIGYGIGLSVNLYEVRQLESAGFAAEALLRTFMTYDLGRIPMTLGHVGLIALLCRAQALSGVSRVFGAVGRLALTNYLAQSVLCMFIFTGAGLAWYGQLARHELYYVAIAIWAVQLAWSPFWLRRFRHGPAEWLWRSLTYGRRQPLRRGSSVTPRVSAST